MSQQKGGSFVRDKLAGDVLAFVSHSRYRYVRERSGVAAASSASFRISDLVISREKLSRLMEQFIYIYISQHVELYTLHTSNLLSRFHFSRRREEKGERGACIVRTRAKFVASIRSFPTIRTRVTRPHCGGEDRGKFFPFCNFLSRGAASSQQIPREESLRTVHFVISVGREGMKRAV